MSGHQNTGRRTTLLSLTECGVYIYFTLKKIQLCRNVSRVNEAYGISNKQYSSDFNDLAPLEQVRILYGCSRKYIRSLRELDPKSWVNRCKYKIDSKTLENDIIKYLENIKKIIKSTEFTSKKSEYKDMDYVKWIKKHSTWVDKTDWSGYSKNNIAQAYYKWCNKPENGSNPLGMYIYMCLYFNLKSVYLYIYLVFTVLTF